MWHILYSELNCAGSVVHLYELSVLFSDGSLAPTPTSHLHLLPPPPTCIYFSAVLTFPGEGQSKGDMLEMELNLSDVFCYKNMGRFISFKNTIYLFLDNNYIFQSDTNDIVCLVRAFKNFKLGCFLNWVKHLHLYLFLML